MNRRNLLKSFIFYTTLIIGIFFFIVFFVKVPIQYGNEDIDNRSNSIKLQNADYPNYDGVYIANQTGVQKPKSLVNNNTAKIQDFQGGRLLYEINNTKYELIWNDDTVHLNGTNINMYLNDSGIVQVNNTSSHPNSAERILFGRVSSQFDYNDFTDRKYATFASVPAPVEKKIQEQIESKNMTAVEAWRVDDRDFIRYRSNNGKVSVVITESGWIKSYKDSDITYQVERNNNTYVLRPKWSI